MEIFDVCDENGLPTGETVERSAAHREREETDRLGDNL
jgi:hypothetical protein